ncbi:hypothetical protein FYZ36_02235 [Mobiluncus mulieris]|nr:hypothetical protein [Mobiluncus mulieris]
MDVVFLSNTCSSSGGSLNSGLTVAARS